MTKTTRIVWKKSKTTQTNERTSHVHRSEELILIKCFILSKTISYPSANSNDILHRDRINNPNMYNMYMELAKIPNSQINPEKEQSKRHYTF